MNTDLTPEEFLAGPDDGPWTDLDVRGLAMPGATGDDWRMLDCRFDGCDFAGARFRDLSMIRVTFVDCRFTGADLSGASLREVRFVRCKLDDANFRFVTGAEGVVFEDCVVVELDIHGAAWTASFPGCDVRELVGLDGLRGATLTRAQAIDLGVRLAIEAGIVVVDQ